MQQTRDYRSDIDGLRAVAILGVLLYHAGVGFPGGYVGVDVFFVISGFLIIGHLHQSFGRGAFSFFGFWERRFRRLIPALMATTFVTAILGYFLLLPADLKDLGGALIAQPLMSSNLYFWRAVKGGYFGDPPQIRPLLHTWSLGVEEQFYLLFPLVVGFFFRRDSKGAKLGFGLATLTLLSFTASALLTTTKGVLAFFTLPTRAWELTLGGILHFSPPVRSRWLREFLGVAGFMMIGYACLRFDDVTVFPGAAALLPCLGTALVIQSSGPQGRSKVGVLLAQPPMVFLGQLSYSLYLWHWPLFAFSEYLGVIDRGWIRWLLVGLSFVFAYVSWRFIETPIREKRYLGTPKQIFLVFGFYAMVSLGLGIFYRGQRGFPGNWDAQAMALFESSDSRAPAVNVGPTCENRKPLPLGIASSSSKSDFLLWGDSHAMALGPLLDRLAQDTGRSGIQITRAGQAPLAHWSYKISRNTPTLSEQTEWFEFVKEMGRLHGVKNIFLAAYWEIYMSNSFSEDLRTTVQDLNRSGFRVFVVFDGINQSYDIPRSFALRRRWGLPAPATSALGLSNALQENRHITTALEGLICEGGALETVDITQFLVDNDLPVEELGGICLYRDDDHFSAKGVMALAPIFRPLMSKCYSPAP